ncbi:MAG: hypothetical protein MUF26_06505 [Syntrophales bacterium]|nr:hypothetical protein [Syntrophales bacterium]
MFICQASLSLKSAMSFGVALWCLLYLLVSEGLGCSCAWEGPFLKVAPQSPLIIHGHVLRHHDGMQPFIDILVLETLKGGLLDSGLQIQMEDGVHCRPNMQDFPVGTEWIFALNGPGAKPAQGWALSHCGEYWLGIVNGHAFGRVDGRQLEKREISLADLRLSLGYPEFKETFSGRIVSGRVYRRPFGGRFELVLEPMPQGWEIRVYEKGRKENLARLTPPLHSAPNPREIDGWQLADPLPDCAIPYGAEAGPENPRRFIFSPEVGTTIDGPKAIRAVTPEEVERISRFGRGKLTIGNFELAPGSSGQCPGIKWLEFNVQLEVRHP